MRTDYAALQWLCRKAEPSSQVARWLEVLSEFQYRMEHRPGKRHGNSDGFSGQSCPANCKQCCRIQQVMRGPSKEQIRLELQEHSPVATESAIPLDTGTMGVSIVVGTNNTASGTTSRTGPSTTCEVGRGNLGGQLRQSASAIEVDDPIAEVPVAEL